MHRRTLLGAIVVGGGLTLVGCGPSEGPPSPPPESPTPEPIPPIDDANSAFKPTPVWESDADSNWLLGAAVVELGGRFWTVTAQADRGAAPHLVGIPVAGGEVQRAELGDGNWMRRARVVVVDREDDPTIAVIVDQTITLFSVTDDGVELKDTAPKPPDEVGDIGSGGDDGGDIVGVVSSRKDAHFYVLTKENKWEQIDLPEWHEVVCSRDEGSTFLSVRNAQEGDLSAELVVFADKKFSLVEQDLPLEIAHGYGAAATDGAYLRGTRKGESVVEATAIYVGWESQTVVRSKVASTAASLDDVVMQNGAAALGGHIIRLGQARPEWLALEEFSIAVGMGDDRAWISPEHTYLLGGQGHSNGKSGRVGYESDGAGRAVTIGDYETGQGPIAMSADGKMGLFAPSEDFPNGETISSSAMRVVILPVAG